MEGAYKPRRIANFKDGIFVWVKQKTVWHEDKKTGKMVPCILDLDQHPWGDNDGPVLAKVVHSYPTYILLEIQPHINPNAMDSTRMTVPYMQTVSKHDIFCQRTMVKPCESYKGDVYV